MLEKLSLFIRKKAKKLSGQTEHLEAFDSHWYYENYLANNDEKTDPLEHYRNKGWKQGLNPNADFDTNAYIEAYPEVLETGLDPVSHYEKIGRAKGFLPQGKPFQSSSSKYFFEEAGKFADPKIMEVGTKQSVEGVSTHSFHAFKNVQRSNYIMVDVEQGSDVDVVEDLHALPQDWENSFDIAIAGAVFEHLERPWIAAKEMARVMKKGGLVLIITHQTFPLHGYPSDFFRFSKDALRLIFEDAGFVVERAEYNGRTRIIPPDFILLDNEQIKSWNKSFPSYAIVTVVARKP